MGKKRLTFGEPGYADQQAEAEEREYRRDLEARESAGKKAKPVTQDDEWLVLDATDVLPEHDTMPGVVKVRRRAVAKAALAYVACELELQTEELARLRAESAALREEYAALRPNPAVGSTWKGAVTFDMSLGTGYAAGSPEYRDEDAWRLRVRGPNKCTHIEIHIKPEVLGHALGARGNQPAYAEINVSTLGMIEEHKMVEVSFPWETPKPGETREDQKRRAVAPYEVDGWRAYMGDVGNHHRLVSKTDKYRVNFHRFVPAPGGT